MIVVCQIVAIFFFENQRKVTAILRIIFPRRV